MVAKITGSKKTKVWYTFPDGLMVAKDPARMSKKEIEKFVKHEEKVAPVSCTGQQYN